MSLCKGTFALIPLPPRKRGRISFFVRRKFQAGRVCLKALSSASHTIASSVTPTLDAWGNKNLSWVLFNVFVTRLCSGTMNWRAEPRLELSPLGPQPSMQTSYTTRPQKGELVRLSFSRRVFLLDGTTLTDPRRGAILLMSIYYLTLSLFVVNSENYLFEA